MRRMSGHGMVGGEDDEVSAFLNFSLPLTPKNNAARAFVSGESYRPLTNVCMQGMKRIVGQSSALQAFESLVGYPRAFTQKYWTWLKNNVS
jgi:hypothetical protein